MGIVGDLGYRNTGMISDVLENRDSKIFGIPDYFNVTCMCIVIITYFHGS